MIYPSTEELFQKAVSGNTSLGKYLKRYYPEKISIEDMFFYKNFLNRFERPGFEINHQNFGSWDQWLFCRLAAASFSTWYHFIIGSGENNMTILLTIDRQGFLTDELQDFQIEFIMLQHIKEQLYLEKKASEWLSGSVFLSLQRNFKLKEWVVKSAMGSSNLLVLKYLAKKNA